MTEKILEVLNSPCFKRCLNKININYPNLKQETFIRNTILEILNHTFCELNSSFKAFAEHPRDKTSRVDLSIINKDNLADPFLIELKFQYTNDYRQLVDFKTLIEHDFQRYVCHKQSDLFILIISYWDKSDKQAFDNEWGLTSNLSRFLSISDEWKNNVKNLFCEYKDTKLDELIITVSEPYQTNYCFFLISREQVSV